MKQRRITAMVLALLLALGLLAGCGGSGKDSTQQLSATVYVPKYMDLGVKLDDIVSGSCTDGTYLYLIGETDERTEHQETGSEGEIYTYYDYTYNYDIYRVPLEGGAAEKLPNYTAPSVPEGYEGSVNIESISTGADGTLWVTEYVYIWGKKGAEGDMDYGVDDGFTVEPRAMSASADVAIAVPETPAGDDSYVDFESSETVTRRQISSDGTELASFEISNLAEKLELEYIDRTSFGPEGNIYVTSEQTLYVLDSDMNAKFTLELPPDTWSPITPLGENKACINYYFYDEAAETSSYRVKLLDLEKQDWGVEYALPTSSYSIYPGGGDYLFYYTVGDAVFGWPVNAPAGTETGTRLFSWIEADVNSDNIQDFMFLPDGRVAALTREWKTVESEDESRLNISVVLMTATPRDQLPEKTTLTYATMYLNYDVRNRIIDFNKTSEKYRIEVKNYAEYNTANDSSAGLQKMNTEIIAGVVPDILCTDSIPLKQYAAKGVLEDLWPFIDNDPDLGRGKLMTKPLEADEVDGKLYEVFPNFSIQTVIGPKKIVGDRMSWTLQDLQDALAKMPEGCAIFGEEDTKEGMLNYVLSMNMENFVNWDTGECSFDSDNFKSLLAFCNTFATEFSYENVDWETWEDSDTRILNGKQMLSQGYLSNFSWSFQRCQALFHDGGPSYIGFPMEDGSVGSSFSLSTGHAISSTCKDKDGAWSFVRQALLPTGEGNRYYGGFPINKADFDAAVEKAMTPEYYTDENGDPVLDENGEPIISNLGSLWLNDGSEIPFHLPTQEEIDQFMALYNAVTSVYRYDTSIYEIVNDVAGSYFAGDRSLDDAAGLIQNRVKIYVGESK